ncbi:YaiI/YqxD family protein [Halobacillus sp. H74]|uniref:YaiI/YqxD family protein n=1 Tax=Halobacillus sp. H74 TaxID=3457436 RepID=UPI003FCED99F
MPKLNVKVWVDADSCPVQNEIVEVCNLYEIQPQFIATVNHYSPVKSNEGWTFVDDGSQSVDIYILNQVRFNDIVITQDLSLAVLLTSKGVYVLTPRGKLVKENDADNIMNQKFIRQQTMKRRKKWKGPSAFTNKDGERFRSALQDLLSDVEGI